MLQDDPVVVSFVGEPIRLHVYATIRVNDRAAAIATEFTRGYLAPGG